MNYNFCETPSKVRDYISQSEVLNKMGKHTLRRKTQASVKDRKQERLLSIIVNACMRC